MVSSGLTVAEEPVGSMVHLVTPVVARPGRAVVMKRVVKVLPLVLMGQKVLLVLVLMMLRVHGRAEEETQVMAGGVVQVVRDMVAGVGPVSDL